MEDSLAHLWDSTYKMCVQKGVPKERLEQCTNTSDLIHILREIRDRDDHRAQLKKTNKRFKNRDKKQHGLDEKK